MKSNLWAQIFRRTCLLSLLTTTVYGVEIGGYGGIQSGSSETKESAAGMGVLSFPVDNLYSMDLRVGYFSTDSEIKTLSKAVVQATSLEFVPRLCFKSGRVTPYLAAGPAIFFMKETLDSEVMQAGQQFGVTVKEDLDNAFGFVAGGGFDVEVAQDVAVGFDITYLYIRPKVTATVSDSFITVAATDHVNLSTVRALLGIKVRFGEGSTPRTDESMSARPAVSDRPAETPLKSTPMKETHDFIIVSYRELMKDLSKGEGPYLKTLLDMLKLKAEDKPQAIKKIQALSEAYSNINEFADRVVDLYRAHIEETAYAVEPSTPVAQPEVTPIPTGPAWEPAPALMDVRDFTQFLRTLSPGIHVQLYLTDGQLYSGEFERHQDGLVWLKVPRSVQVFDHKIRAMRKLPIRSPANQPGII